MPRSDDSLAVVDRKATTKSFNFATKRNLDFYYVSAADGTNVVKVCQCCCGWLGVAAPYTLWTKHVAAQVFNEAIRKGLECKEKPPDDFFVRARCRPPLVLALLLAFKVVSARRTK